MESTMKTLLSIAAAALIGLTSTFALAAAPHSTLTPAAKSVKSHKALKAHKSSKKHKSAKKGKKASKKHSKAKTAPRHTTTKA
jgi:hypothetical protein